MKTTTSNAGIIWLNCELVSVYPSCRIWWNYHNGSNSWCINPINHITTVSRHWRFRLDHCWVTMLVMYVYCTIEHLNICARARQVSSHTDLCQHCQKIMNCGFNDIIIAFCLSESISKRNIWWATKVNRQFPSL